MYDEAMFLWHTKEGYLDGILVSHVDDFVYCGSPKWNQMVIEVIMKKFQISSHERGSFKYVGFNVIQDELSVRVDQQKYVEGLKLIELSPERAKQNDDKLNNEEK